MGKNILSFVIVLSAMTIMAAYANSVSAQDQAGQSSAPATASADSTVPANNVAPANPADVPNNNSAANIVPAADRKANPGTNRQVRPRVGFGFNGIPFDGSHIAAMRTRRSYRGR